MSSIPSRNRNTPRKRNMDLVALIPDFPFHYGAFLNGAKNERGLFNLPDAAKNKQVLVVGAGASGAVAAYELLRMGVKPVLVEASNRYGGRLNAQRVGGETHQVIAEMGAMRFPESGKAGKFYFEKVGMARNSAPFPNPGSEAAGSTVVDYRGLQEYYEPGSDIYPIPEKYTELEDQMFGGDGVEGFLEKPPVYLTAVQERMQEGSIDEAYIKQVWNRLLTDPEHRYDDVSFYAGLKQLSPWSPDDINLFGQIGFGTGGWNTDYPNCFLEVLRVLYTGLDVDHRLMYDGTTTLPSRLISLTPAQLGDASDASTIDMSVERSSANFLASYFPDNLGLLGKEVRHIARNADHSLRAIIRDVDSGVEREISFDAIIYTPHVRILDKFRHYGSESEYRETTQLLDADLWEAVEYTHYMQSAKIFMAATTPFWKHRDTSTGKPGMYRMSVTLSDRLTRGTYLVDYGDNANPDGVKGCGIFLSYTWNDDSLKFLGDRNAPGELLTHAHMCRTVLQDIYPNLRLADYLAPGGQSEIEINWEDEPLYLGAFKMNLPGQYEYQRRLFSQFMAGLDEMGAPAPVPDSFVLAGDDISWVAGWVEGAITSAINAVNKVAVLFGGSDWEGSPGPISRWNELKPIELPATHKAARTAQRATRKETSDAV